MDLYKIVNMKLFSNNPETYETRATPALSPERPPHSGKHCKGGGGESGDEPRKGLDTKTNSPTDGHGIN
jgi:hypothetical protein